jgi:predicted lipoprotein with Yx(FWY)xxD motif
MLTKRLLPLALAAAGTLALTACSGQAPIAQAADAPATGSALSLLSGTAKANGAQPSTGDWALRSGGALDARTAPIATKWVQLTAGSAGDLDPVVVNGAGLTLYRFDTDTASPSRSNCAGACAVTWPPLTVQPGGKIFIDGVRKKDVGVVKRDDGTLQVTIKGWPAYRFAKDTEPGDTKGQGVGGVWFGLRPDGGKAGAQEGDNGGGESKGDDVTATSAVLFDDANFSDDGASQGVAGAGCQNLARPGVTSSVAVQGSLKLWTGKDCTGESKLIDGDVRDLATVGFDDELVSVKLR